MTTQTAPTGRKPAGRLACRLQRPLFSVRGHPGRSQFRSGRGHLRAAARIPPDGYSLVVLDLAELTFLSSLAMGALVEYRRGLSRRGAEVRLANVQAQVWLALESAGLGRLFEPIDLPVATRPVASAVA